MFINDYIYIYIYIYDHTMDFDQWFYSYEQITIVICYHCVYYIYIYRERPVGHLITILIHFIAKRIITFLSLVSISMGHLHGKSPYYS